MTTTQTFNEQFDKLRNVDLVAELKKLDLRNIDLRNLDLDSLDVFDVRETFAKIDLDALDVFDVRELIERLDLPTVTIPSDFDEARTQLDEMRAKFESMVKDTVDTAAGFAPATRRDIEHLEERVVAAAAAAAAPKKAPAKKRTAKKATAKKATAKKAS